MPQAFALTFLGTSTCLPELHNDTACFVLQDRYLVDTGWDCISNMRNNGLEPGDLRYLILTHLHHDHYQSLHSLLFYLLCKRIPLSQLHIVGPQADVERVVRLAYDYLQIDRFYEDVGYPHVLPLAPGDQFADENLLFTTCAADHAVDALCFRVTDTQTGRVLAFTGDTAYSPHVVGHVQGADLLIHECSLGTAPSDTPANAQMRHSNAEDAGKTAQNAQVGRLMLVHGAESNRLNSIRAAQSQYSGEVLWPERYKSYDI